MELTIALAISILSVVITVVNFALSRKDKAIKDVKETNMDLVQYQLSELKEDYKNIASDIKEIKKMLDTYKESLTAIVKQQMEEHIKIYHKEVK